MAEIRKGKASPDIDAVQVQTYLSPKDKSRRLAIIMYDYHSGNKKVKFSNIANKEEMSHEEAIRKAVEFADAHNIPYVYEYESS